MPQKHDDYEKLLAHKRFLNDVEQGIRYANREVIHADLPHITKDGILSFAISVARLRGAYLSAAMRLGKDGQGAAPSRDDVADVRAKREMYEEARGAFDALREAIERGYVEVTELEGA